ncbi:EAL domain-containing protein [Sphingomonas daechungensis]|uniref:EAL domain-containing protein n=2 Tax=Sphingomonas daechungensis TaxID=1176646 RepID=A0ABX6SXT0_9SPHN|nr:EAL domain-containing protein [Sphingomonas daechungensis]QNP42397.1 EAL domain-containing protein [Sphingomonas daechungensis]
MAYRWKLLSPMVSAAIVLIVVTNYLILHIAGRPDASASELAWLLLPIALPTTIVVILVMSSLYHALQEVIGELERGRLDALSQAQHDPLTGLANKRLLQQRVDQAISRFNRGREKFAVLMLDLDDFKRVNDLLGHQSGDELLREAAARLASLVRDTDTVARFGGDEFLILQSTVDRPTDVRRLCARINEDMQRAYRVGDRDVRLPVTIGAVLANDDLGDAADYVRAADMALYAAKAGGKNCSRFFSQEMDALLQRRDRLETDLKLALATGEGLNVHFQPQLAADGKVVGAEALFRWTHSEFGDIAAVEAIAIAEECRFIDILAERVLRDAARFARSWPSLSVAVNMSPAQFTGSRDLAAELGRIVSEEGVSPSQIELEITERLLVTDEDDCEKQIASLRNLGFRVALDDFGTGYSSLNYLRRFKVDRLKLDRTFALNAEINESVAIVRAAVGLAHSLGLDVIAEGIETKLQERVAFEAGCDAVQGNFYAAPMTATAFAAFLDSQDSAAA